MKPFRLINRLELAQIREQFTRTVFNWQEHYACMPITIRVDLPTVEHHFSSAYHFTIEHDCVAMIQGNLNDFFQVACLGFSDANFTPLFHLLTSQLIAEICPLPDGTLMQSNKLMPWLYHGSPSLLVRLETMGQKVELLLNPSYCKSILPHTVHTASKLVPRDKAVGTEIVNLHVALNAYDIELLDLINLKPGDLLITKHQFNHPLAVQYDQSVLTDSQLGDSGNFKSILIKRKS